jgi:hypothetical protein
VGRLRVRINAPSSGAQVRIDGRLVPAAALGLPTVVMPGRISVVVEVPDGRSARRDVDVAAGKEVDVDIDLPPADRALPSPGSEAPRPEGRTSDTTPSGPSPQRRAAMWTAFGVGAGGLAGFGTFLYLTNSQFNRLNDACTPSGCPATSRDEIDRGKTFEALTYVSLGIGVAATALGIVLLTLPGPSGRPVVRVTALPHAIGAGGTF